MTKNNNELTSKLILYSTIGCHLCEEARINLQTAINNVNAISPIDFEIDEIDVATDDKYLPIQDKIPIIELENGNRLIYPFTIKEIEKEIMESNL